MQTHCNANQLSFQAFDGRSVSCSFYGGHITSDSGGLFLGEIKGARGSFNGSRGASPICVTRRSSSTASMNLSHSALTDCVSEMKISNEHDLLRADPLALLCGKQDLEGKDRRNVRDRCKPMAGKSTLNRLETAVSLLSDRPRYKKIVAEMSELEEYFQKSPRLLVLDFDATDDPLHGKQEGRFFHGYYELLSAVVRFLRRSSSMGAAAKSRHRRQRRALEAVCVKIDVASI